VRKISGDPRWNRVVGRGSALLPIGEQTPLGCAAITYRQEIKQRRKTRLIVPAVFTCRPKLSAVTRTGYTWSLDRRRLQLLP